MNNIIKNHSRFQSLLRTSRINNQIPFKNFSRPCNQKNISNPRNFYHQKNVIIPVIRNYTNHYPFTSVISNLTFINSCQPVNNGLIRLRGLSTKPKFMENLPTPNNQTKNAIALGGAILTFLIFQPTMNFILSGALAFGAYKLVKRSLNNIWPPIHPLYPTMMLTRKQLNQIENTFWRHIFPSIRGITSEMNRSQKVIEEIYSSSIIKIQAAYNNDRDIKFLFGNYDSSMIKFSEPQTIISETLAASDSRGNYQKTHGVTIEYIATGMNGESAFVKATGYLDKNSEVMFKEIRLLWPHIGREINIPLQNTNNFEDNKYGPNVMEAEYRDIKE
ncbi:hypothetical protein F8M41_010773 [Gigaspora margarita]|uniref:Uncharacterized protein n=1 Tax=Gigaspora margarita TaxID=4874 RepID=A0A8H3X059_GIGMA|nr:hypothetical protein F8M41_010773 [Gigaspora margarita]